MDDSEESSIERNERYAKMEDVELVLRFLRIDILTNGKI